MRDPKAILITGASSGLGAALARAYAAPGRHLFLGGRDAARLGAVAADCTRQGAEAAFAAHDVTDGAALAGWIRACDADAPLDLVIANAGISGGMGGGGETEMQTRAIFSVNVDGVVNTVLPALSAMRARRRGQIAIMSSLASFYGFSGAPAYSASKAAVRVWGESLHGAYAKDGLEFSVICPGFITTPLTDANDYTMPMIMPASRAARIIKRGLARGKARIAFPRTLYAAVWAASALPPAATHWLNRRLPQKV